MQRIKTNIGDSFRPAEKSLWDSFMPALFQGVGEGIQRRGFTHLLMKQAGLALPYLMLTDLENWTESCVLK